MPTFDEEERTAAEENARIAASWRLYGEMNARKKRRQMRSELLWVVFMFAWAGSTVWMLGGFQ